jgi:hypothetical protein
MSTSINQIIEVRKDGKWQYVPLAAVLTENNNTLQKCGSVRDLFAYKWYGADNYLQSGVPEDISKEAREAMVYEDQDFIGSGACWISAAQFEALTEELRSKAVQASEKVTEAKMKCDITERLVRIEDILLRVPDEQKPESEDFEKLEDEVDYLQDDLEDAVWAWVNLERNWAEITAYVEYFTSGDYSMSDIRVIMFVS